MQDVTVLAWIGVALSCLSAAALSMVWMTRGMGRKRQTVDPFGPGSARDPVFLFEGNVLLDASAAGRALLARGPGGEGWEGLYTALAGRFSDFPSDSKDVKDKSPMLIPATDSSYPGEILAEWIDGITRVHLRNTKPFDAASVIDPHRLRAAESELDSLRHAMDGAPYPIWQMDGHGRVVWFNTSYASLYRRARRAEVDRSDPLFQTGDRERLAGSRSRVSVPLEGNEGVLWFDVLQVQHEGFSMYYAVDVNAVVSAEIAQRNFVQTLAKTFAQLSIGLAIFDRNRQLALFNPALIDLTALPADFLSARPNLLSFFDRLRDNRMMPEPKNYSSWRDQMAELVEAAADGRYHETWSLPSGSIYRVSGRPHPDGAVAFLIEDITAEVTLTRRFRSELELSQSILDQLDEAVAVFLPNGVLNISNAAYRNMWSVDPENSFADTTIVDAIRHWQAKSDATPIWGEIREFVLARDNRADWTATITTRTGESLRCTVAPIQSGATMVSFRQRPADVLESTPPEIAEPSDA